MLSTVIVKGGDDAFVRHILLRAIATADYDECNRWAVR